MPISANIMKLSLSIMLILRSSVGKENHAQVNNVGKLVCNSQPMLKRIYIYTAPCGCIKVDEIM